MITDEQKKLLAKHKDCPMTWTFAHKDLSDLVRSEYLKIIWNGKDGIASITDKGREALDD